MSAPTTLQPAPASYGERLILVIEDDVPIAEALALIIEDLGYQAVIATDGLTGLELARSRQPRMILTDLMLPKLSGQQVVAQLPKFLTKSPGFDLRPGRAGNRSKRPWRVDDHGRAAPAARPPRSV